MRERLQVETDNGRGRVVELPGDVRVFICSIQQGGVLRRNRRYCAQILYKKCARARASFITGRLSS